MIVCVCVGVIVCVCVCVCEYLLACPNIILFQACAYAKTFFYQHKIMAIFVRQKKNLIVAKTKTSLSRIKSIEGKILYILVIGCLNVRLLRSHKQLDRSPPHSSGKL